MSRLIFLYVFLIAARPLCLQSQVRWDGGAGTNRWNDAANWVNDLIPDNTDRVILDNSVVHGSYTVQLPEGNVAVTVASLSMVPDDGNHIEAVLPSGNISVPGFVA